MDLPIPTVKIKSADVATGYMIINQKDYDPETMELWQEPGEVPEPAQEVLGANAISEAPLTPSEGIKEAEPPAEESARRSRRGP